MTETAEIVKANSNSSATKSAPLALIENFKAMQRIAQMAIASKLVLGADDGTPEEKIARATMMIMYGAELGMPPFSAMQNLVCIRGRITYTAQYMAARIKSSRTHNYRVKKLSETICVVEMFERNGDKFESLGEVSFSIEDARKAGLVKGGGNYDKYPSAMMFARAISKAARMHCPHLFEGNAYTPDDFDGVTIEGEVIEVSAPAPAQIAEQPQQPEASPAKDDAPNADDFFSK